MDFENEIIEFAKPIFSLTKRPTVILTKLKRVSIGRLIDDWLAYTPGKTPISYGRFDKSGKFNKLIRYIGHALHWRWLYEKGRFNAWGEHLITQIVTITLDEYTMPDNRVVHLGYDLDTNVLAVLPPI